MISLRVTTGDYKYGEVRLQAAPPLGRLSIDGHECFGRKYDVEAGLMGETWDQKRVKANFHSGVALVEVTEDSLSFLRGTR